MKKTNSEKTLAGKRIVITRPEGQSATLGDILKNSGAIVLEVPLISVSQCADPEIVSEVFSEIGQYDWLVFSSANGVDGFFNRFFEHFKDIRALGICRIACVGNATARAVETLHLQPEIVPESGTAETLARAIIAAENIEHLRVLVVTGNQNRDTLVKILSEEGRAIVDTLPVYETRENDVANLSATADFRAHGADAIVFASPSAVAAFIAQASSLKLAKGAIFPKAIAIGNATASALREAGIPLAAQAETPTTNALVNAIYKAIEKN